MTKENSPQLPTVNELENKLNFLRDLGREQSTSYLQYNLGEVKSQLLELMYPEPVIDKKLKEVGLWLGLELEHIEHILEDSKKGFLSTIIRKGKHNIFREQILRMFDGQVSWDIMDLEIRFAGELTCAYSLWVDFEANYDVDVDEKFFTKEITQLAQKTPYNPITNYLNSLPTVNDPENTLNKLYEIMGITAPLHKTFVRKWLIGAVARAYQPGCKMDTSLILHGHQGYKKTLFFENLFGEWFQTSSEHNTVVDELLAMYKGWCTELGEIEYSFSKKAIGHIKAFLSTSKDVFRVPYGYKSTKNKRHFVICGTTNETDILSDSTGNRRFWIVPINKKIDPKEIENIRDEIWSAICTIYKKGETWWLNDQQEEDQNQWNKNFEGESPWEEIIEDCHRDHPNGFTLKLLMENYLGFCKTELNKRKLQGEVGSLLRKMDFDKKPKKIGGKSVNVWVKIG